jgi:hypothetical protein
VLVTVWPVVFAVAGCGKDRPTSFQEAVYGTWKALEQTNRYQTMVLDGRTGAFTGTVLAGQDAQGNPITSEVKGVFQASGNSLTIVVGTDRQTYTWSVERDVLTLSGGFTGAQRYARA